MGVLASDSSLYLLSKNPPVASGERTDHISNMSLFLSRKNSASAFFGI